MLWCCLFAITRFQLSWSLWCLKVLSFVDDQRKFAHKVSSVQESFFLIEASVVVCFPYIHFSNVCSPDPLRTLSTLNQPIPVSWAILWWSCWARSALPSRRTSLPCKRKGKEHLHDVSPTESPSACGFSFSHTGWFRFIWESLRNCSP